MKVWSSPFCHPTAKMMVPRKQGASPPGVGVDLGPPAVDWTRGAGAKYPYCEPHLRVRAKKSGKCILSWQPRAPRLRDEKFLKVVVAGRTAHPKPVARCGYGTHAFYGVWRLSQKARPTKLWRCCTPRRGAPAESDRKGLA